MRKWFAHAKTQVALRPMANRRRVLTLPTLESAPTRRRRQTAPTPRPTADAAGPEPMQDGSRTPERPPSPTVPVPPHLRQQQQQQPDSSAPANGDDDGGEQDVPIPRMPPSSPQDGVAGPSSGLAQAAEGVRSTNELAFLNLLREVVLRRARDEPENAANCRLTLEKLERRIQNVIRERDMAVLRNGYASPPGSPEYSPTYPTEPFGNSEDDYQSD